MKLQGGAVVHKRNLDEIEWAEMSHGSRFRHLRKTMTPFDAPTMPKVGISLYRLEPGKRAFPFHEHLGNDEALLVTTGKGTLRYGDEEVPLREGDYVYLPAASGCAHQVINTSDDALEYYCLSSMLLPEVVRYPDSKKVGAIGPGTGPVPRRASFLHDNPVDYWDRERGD
jgi:uncharacterized cupin superfamily protein